VVDNVLLRALPFPHGDRIMLMGNTYPGAGVGGERGTNSGVPDYYDRLSRTDVYDEQAMARMRSVALEQNGVATRIPIRIVTPSFFRLLEVRPLIGRTFTEAEGEPGNDKKVVLSYALWQSQFGGDPSAIGRDVRLDGEPYTVVGVMPENFFFVTN